VAEPHSLRGVNKAGKRRRGHGLLRAAVVVAALLVAAYALTVPGGLNLFAPVYDGWKVGSLDTCPTPNFDPAVSQPVTWDCDASLATWLDAARERLDIRDPAHAPVVRGTLHQTATSKPVHYCCEIAVFELGDGSVRAIGVAHIGVDYQHVAAFDYGPDR